MRRIFSRNAKLALSALPIAIGCALAQEGDPPLPVPNPDGEGGEETGGTSTGGTGTGGTGTGGASGSSSGTSGSGTTGGASGSGTTGGASGSAMTGGSGGAAMTGGSAGKGGTAGTGGTAGSAGKGGTAGSAPGGTGGASAGSAGKGGTAGTGGKGGTAGSAAGGTGATGMQLFSDDFESGTSQWTSMAASPATWSIVTDGSMVYQAANAQQNSAFHATTAGDLSWTNVRVTARVKVISPAGSASDRFAGLCTRFRDANNYHCLALRTDLRFGIRSKVGGSGTNSPAVGTVVAGTWYNLRIEAVGTTVTGYVNDVSRGSVTTTLTSGRIALAAPGMNAVFDDVRVTVP